MIPKNETIFVIDDNDSVRSALCRLLTKRCFDVVECCSSTEFLEAYDPFDAGCIVSDQNMPEMTGLDLLVVLKDRGCSTPVVFVTGHRDRSLTTQALEAGAFTVLTKPLRMAELVTTITSALSSETLLMRTGMR